MNEFIYTGFINVAGSIEKMVNVSSYYLVLLKIIFLS